MSQAKATFQARNNDGELAPLTVRVGDYVGFKSDIEQYGAIISIKPTSYGDFALTLYNQNGFEGHYIGGDTKTVVRSSDIWVD